MTTTPAEREATPERDATPLPRSPSSGSVFDRLSETQMTAAILLFGIVLYLPLAGSYGLWDPWETHYGEVARQMVVRGDAISLFWEGAPTDPPHFWSKPVLTFWVMSLAMKIAGIGGVGSPAGEFAVGTKVEWALRVPFCLMGVLALYAVYLVTSRFVSRRAGVLAAVVLGTMPMFALIARQAMTDMPFVGPMTMALALGALALLERDDKELPRGRIGRVTFPHHPLFYVTLGLAALVILPQLALTFFDVSWRLPGRTTKIPGYVVFAPYAVGFAAFVWMAARTRYKAPFYLYIAGILCGLAVLAKGLAGLGLPVIVFIAYLAFTWNWHRLARAQVPFAIGGALLVCALVAVPWHHAMLIRHGFPFWNELYGDNHWRRMVTGRHGNRGSFEYFLRELGYAALPWIPVLPAALSWVVLRKPRADGRGGDLGRREAMYAFGAIWFVAAYAVVSFSMTKFHHYILPALPGLAIVVACFLDDLLEGNRGRVALCAALTGVPVLGLVIHDLVSAQKSAQLFIWLFSYDYVNQPEGRDWPVELDYRVAIAAFAIVIAAATLLLAPRRTRRFAPAALGLVAVAFTYFLLDVYIKQTSDRWSQKPLIAKYYQQRRGPEERLIAWQMYWRGETFYTKNEIYEGPAESRTVFLGDRNQEDLKAYFGRNRGKRMFFVVEKTRWNTLRSLLPAGTENSLRVVDDQNNKFFLATADL